MERIIDPVKPEKLITELRNCRLLRRSHRGTNEIYSFTFRDAPLIMLEVARLREEAFRAISCGSGNRVDLDDYDKGSEAYHQLIVWNPLMKEIIGGYRYALGTNYLHQTHLLSMAHYFRFSKKFTAEYLPYSLELGRAWVNPQYQTLAAGKHSIFALDNLWEGIGAVISENENIRYLFGKITIPENYHPTARMLLSWYLDHYFSDKNRLLRPVNLAITPRVTAIAGHPVTGVNLEHDLKIIGNYIKSLGIFIPPLISAYLKLTRKMITFGTTVNPELGNAYETGILIAVKDIRPEKYARYIRPNHHNHTALADQL